MKNKFLLTILSIVMIIFIVMASYFWYAYFLDLGSDGKYSLIKKNTSSIVLVDETKIYAVFSKGREYDSEVPGYRFKIINNDNQTANYQLKLVEISPSVIRDGCTDDTLLKPSELSYILYFNGNVYKEGVLSDLNGILDNNTINIDTTNTYELKMWINDTVKEFNGEHYHYKVEVEVNK